MTASCPKPIGDKRLTFHNLDWSAFQQIKTLLAPNTRARFTYDHGTLEITQALELHERYARMIERFIQILVMEMGLKLKTMGSTTLDREELDRSAEPDNGYYIQNYALVADHEINLSQDPAPDLIVEVDITHTDLNKNRLYAAMGVPEFWRFNGKNWQILTLTEGEYVEQDRSPTFPIVTKSDLYEFLKVALNDEITAEINFRQLVRTRVQA
ncbi:Uma2 family endonuclease [filamentous cyanobacterium LEGE 11480]|uniref:Uma2 family endonuclease n=1 Tax=Romeriopsis navalis LEGE 11480 TaxID=2777977 RepID=A0A928VRG3_9CYAN|nr:Uma2 family endonuclease [Romeriopsis navalis]MBE9033388.1 Uma2 family endonuclease [Romeriopsis navalis LEGE 11480]